MIKAVLVSQFVIHHFVRKEGTPERTKDDVLSIGIWPEKFNPVQMLQKVNDGNTIFEGNQMNVLTPLETKGFPIEVPRDMYMVAIADISILVEVAEGYCYFCNSVQNEIF